ncbi:hypothetical protein ACVIST_004821 [Bradyrhizobium elkanii]
MLRLRDRLLLENYGLIKLRKRALSPAAALLFDAMKRLGVPNGGAEQGDAAS